jgi:hypothetical protein
MSLKEIKKQIDNKNSIKIVENDNGNILIEHHFAIKSAYAIPKEAYAAFKAIKALDKLYSEPKKSTGEYLYKEIYEMLLEIRSYVINVRALDTDKHREPVTALQQIDNTLDLLRSLWTY